MTLFCAGAVLVVARVMNFDTPEPIAVPRAAPAERAALAAGVFGEDELADWTRKHIEPR